MSPVGERTVCVTAQDVVGAGKSLGLGASVGR